MSPALTAQVLHDIEGVLRAVHTPIVGQELTDDAWEQMCLLIKSHGFGVGRIADKVTAAYVANVQETTAHVMRVLRTAVPYLGSLDEEEVMREEEQDNLSPECAEFVRVYRLHRHRILEAATA